MKGNARYRGAMRSLDGAICIQLEIDESDLTAFNDMQDKTLVYDIKAVGAKRSTNANAYLWRLCTDIGKAIGTSKDSVYEMLLKDFGVFQDYEVPVEAVELIKRSCKYLQELYRYESADGVEMTCVRCWEGSHEYDSKEFAALLDGAIGCAHDIGVRTIDDEEVERLLQDWAVRYGGK